MLQVPCGEMKQSFGWGHEEIGKTNIEEGLAIIEET